MDISSVFAMKEKICEPTLRFDDGDSFTDETGGIVTMAVNQGVWHGADFYLTTSGEGILAKRSFDQ